MMGEKMDGEGLHSENRKRFWRTLGIAFVAGLPVGIAAGFGAGLSDGDYDYFWSWAPDWVVLLLLGFSVATILWGSWKFMRSIDEVELNDNLWASFVAYGIYALLFPTWWVLGKAGIAGEPNDWAIYLAVLTIGFGYYLWRKWRAR